MPRLAIVDIVGEQPDGVVETHVIDGIPVLGGETDRDLSSQPASGPSGTSSGYIALARDRRT